MTLQHIIQQIRGGSGNPRHWLLIHGEARDLSLSTDCALSLVEIDEDSDDLEEIIPPELAARGLCSTIDYETLQACIRWADQLGGRPDDAAAVDVIRYYIRFDSYPPSLGAPDPPSREEIMAGLDREFFTALGPERAGTRCRAPGCYRGAVEFSAFCARHHFENVKKKPCPFFF